LGGLGKTLRREVELKGKRKRSNRGNTVKLDHTMEPSEIIITTDESARYEGKDFFKKKVTNSREIAICEILLDKGNSNPNIVDIYYVGPDPEDGEDCIIMELLQDLHGHHIDRKKFFAQMRDAKNYLQSLNIAYNDWHVGNVGLSIDGNYKLFDFDNSVIDAPDFKRDDDTFNRLNIQESNKRRKPDQSGCYIS
jgi:serine/threonine protein kinase